MPALWTPHNVQREQAARRERHNAELVQMVEAHRSLARWNGQLREIDERLELVRAPENVQHPIWKPGYYHLLIHSKDAPLSVEVYEGPDGEFMDPSDHGSHFLDWLSRLDTWNDRRRKANDEARERAKRAWEREKEREQEDLHTEFAERCKAAFAPGVSFAKTDRPWTNSASAKTEKKEAA